jgi:hypothetical protein
MVVRVEQQVVEIGLIVLVEHGGLAVMSAQLVDHLVLHDADEPGLQLRLAGKCQRLLERGEQRLGHRVFGPGVVAPLRVRTTHQLRAQSLHLTGEVGHVRV